MSYLHDHRLFRRLWQPGDDEELVRKRSEGRLKTYMSCTDHRAWCLEDIERRRHLVELMNQRTRDASEVGRVIPLQELVDLILAEKEETIRRLRRRVEQLEETYGGPLPPEEEPERRSSKRRTRTSEADEQEGARGRGDSKGAGAPRRGSAAKDKDKRKSSAKSAGEGTSGSRAGGSAAGESTRGSRPGGSAAGESTRGSRPGGSAADSGRASAAMDDGEEDEGAGGGRASAAGGEAAAGEEEAAGGGDEPVVVERGMRSARRGRGAGAEEDDGGAGADADEGASGGGAAEETTGGAAAAEEPAVVEGRKSSSPGGAGAETDEGPSGGATAGAEEETSGGAAVPEEPAVVEGRKSSSPGGAGGEADEGPSGGATAGTEETSGGAAVSEEPAVVEGRKSSSPGGAGAEADGGAATGAEEEATGGTAAAEADAETARRGTGAGAEEDTTGGAAVVEEPAIAESGKDDGGAAAAPPAEEGPGGGVAGGEEPAAVEGGAASGAGAEADEGTTADGRKSAASAGAGAEEDTTDVAAVEEGPAIAEDRKSAGGGASITEDRKSAGGGASIAEDRKSAGAGAEADATGGEDMTAFEGGAESVRGEDEEAAGVIGDAEVSIVEGAGGGEVAAHEDEGGAAGPRTIGAEDETAVVEEGGVVEGAGGEDSGATAGEGGTGTDGYGAGRLSEAGSRGSRGVEGGEDGADAQGAPGGVGGLGPGDSEGEGTFEDAAESLPEGADEGQQGPAGSDTSEGPADDFYEPEGEFEFQGDKDDQIRHLKQLLAVKIAELEERDGYLVEALRQLENVNRAVRCQSDLQGRLQESEDTIKTLLAEKARLLKEKEAILRGEPLVFEEEERPELKAKGRGVSFQSTCVEPGDSLEKILSVLQSLAAELAEIPDESPVYDKATCMITICEALQNYANDNELQLSRERTRASQIYETMEAKLNPEVMEEIQQTQVNFDKEKQRFEADIAKMQETKEKLNALPHEAGLDDADESDETWRLRNSLQELEQKLQRQTAEPGGSTDYGERSDKGEMISRKLERYSDLPADVDELQKKVKENAALRARIAELEKQLRSVVGDDRDEWYPAEDMPDDLLQTSSSEEKILMNEVKVLKEENENLKQQLELMKRQRGLGGTDDEMELMRQRAVQSEANVLVMDERLRMMEANVASDQEELEMYRNRCMELEKLQAEVPHLTSVVENFQTIVKERNMLHSRVHELQCAIVDQEDEIKRLLVKIERFAETAERCKNAEAILEEQGQELASQEEEIKSLLKKVEELANIASNQDLASKMAEETSSIITEQEREISNLMEQLDAEGQCREELNSVKKKLDAAKAENDALRKKLDSGARVGMGPGPLEEVVSLQKQVIALMDSLPEKSVPVQSQIDEMTKTLGPVSSSELRSALTQARSAISMAMKEMQQPASVLQLQEELDKQREETNALKEQLRTAVDKAMRGSEIVFERKLSSEQEMRERAEKVAIGASQTLEMKEEELRLLKNQLEMVVQENQNLTAKVKNLESQTMATGDNTTDANASILSDRIMLLENEKNELQEELRQQSEKIDDLEKKLAQGDGIVSEDPHNVGSILRNLSAEIKNVRGMMPEPHEADLHDLVKQQLREIEELQMKISTSEMGDLRRENADLLNYVRKLDYEMETINRMHHNEILDKDDEIRNLERKLFSCLQKVSINADLQDKADRDIIKLKKALADAEIECYRLRELLRRKEEDLDDCRRNLYDRNERLRKLGQLDDATTEDMSMLDKVFDLEKEVARLKETIDEKDKEITSLKRSLKDSRFQGDEDGISSHITEELLRKCEKERAALLDLVSQMMTQSGARAGQSIFRERQTDGSVRQFRNVTDGYQKRSDLYQGKQHGDFDMQYGDQPKSKEIEELKRDLYEINATRVSGDGYDNVTSSEYSATDSLEEEDFILKDLLENKDRNVGAIVDEVRRLTNARVERKMENSDGDEIERLRSELNKAKYNFNLETLDRYFQIMNTGEVRKVRDQVEHLVEEQIYQMGVVQDRILADKTRNVEETSSLKDQLDREISQIRVNNRDITHVQEKLLKNSDEINKLLRDFVQRMNESDEKEFWGSNVVRSICTSQNIVESGKTALEREMTELKKDWISNIEALQTIVYGSSLRKNIDDKRENIPAVLADTNLGEANRQLLSKLAKQVRLVEDEFSELRNEITAKNVSLRRKEQRIGELKEMYLEETRERAAGLLRSLEGETLNGTVETMQRNLAKMFADEFGKVDAGVQVQREMDPNDVLERENLLNSVRQRDEQIEALKSVLTLKNDKLDNLTRRMLTREVDLGRVMKVKAEIQFLVTEHATEVREIQKKLNDVSVSESLSVELETLQKKSHLISQLSDTVILKNTAIKDLADKLANSFQDILVGYSETTLIEKYSAEMRKLKCEVARLERKNKILESKVKDGGELIESLSEEISKIGEIGSVLAVMNYPSLDEVKALIKIRSDCGDLMKELVRDIEANLSLIEGKGNHEFEEEFFTGALTKLKEQVSRISENLRENVEKENDFADMLKESPRTLQKLLLNHVVKTMKDMDGKISVLETEKEALHEALGQREELILALESIVQDLRIHSRSYNMLTDFMNDAEVKNLERIKEKLEDLISKQMEDVNGLDGKGLRREPENFTAKEREILIVQDTMLFRSKKIAKLQEDLLEGLRSFVENSRLSNLIVHYEVELKRSELKVGRLEETNKQLIDGQLERTTNFLGSLVLDQATSVKDLKSKISESGSMSGLGPDVNSLNLELFRLKKNNAFILEVQELMKTESGPFGEERGVYEMSSLRDDISNTGSQIVKQDVTVECFDSLISEIENVKGIQCEVKRLVEQEKIALEQYLDETLHGQATAEANVEKLEENLKRLLYLGDVVSNSSSEINERLENLKVCKETGALKRKVMDLVEENRTLKNKMLLTKQKENEKSLFEDLFKSCDVVEEIGKVNAGIKKVVQEQMDYLKSQNIERIQSEEGTEWERFRIHLHWMEEFHNESMVKNQEIRQLQSECVSLMKKFCSHSSTNELLRTQKIKVEKLETKVAELQDEKRNLMVDFLETLKEVDSLKDLVTKKNSKLLELSTAYENQDDMDTRLKAVYDKLCCELRDCRLAISADKSEDQQLKEVCVRLGVSDCEEFLESLELLNEKAKTLEKENRVIVEEMQVMKEKLLLRAPNVGLESLKPFESSVKDVLDLKTQLEELVKDQMIEMKGLQLKLLEEFKDKEDVPEANCLIAEMKSLRKKNLEINDLQDVILLKNQEISTLQGILIKQMEMSSALGENSISKSLMDVEGKPAVNCNNKTNLEKLYVELNSCVEFGEIKSATEKLKECVKQQLVSLQGLNGEHIGMEEAEKVVPRLTREISSLVARNENISVIQDEIEKKAVEFGKLQNTLWTLVVAAVGGNGVVDNSDICEENMRGKVEDIETRNSQKRLKETGQLERSNLIEIIKMKDEQLKTFRKFFEFQYRNLEKLLRKKYGQQDVVEINLELKDIVRQQKSEIELLQAKLEQRSCHSGRREELQKELNELQAEVDELNEKNSAISDMQNVIQLKNEEIVELQGKWSRILEETSCRLARLLDIEESKLRVNAVTQVDERLLICDGWDEVNVELKAMIENEVDSLKAVKESILSQNDSLQILELNSKVEALRKNCDEINYVQELIQTGNKDFIKMYTNLTKDVKNVAVQVAKEDEIRKLQTMLKDREEQIETLSEILTESNTYLQLDDIDVEVALAGISELNSVRINLTRALRTQNKGIMKLKQKVKAMDKFEAGNLRQMQRQMEEIILFQKEIQKNSVAIRELQTKSVREIKRINANMQEGDLKKFSSETSDGGLERLVQQKNAEIYDLRMEVVIKDRIIKALNTPQYKCLTELAGIKEIQSQVEKLVGQQLAQMSNLEEKIEEANWNETDVKDEFQKEVEILKAKQSEICGVFDCAKKRGEKINVLLECFRNNLRNVDIDDVKYSELEKSLRGVAESEEKLVELRRENDALKELIKNKDYFICNLSVNLALKDEKLNQSEDVEGKRYVDNWNYLEDVTSRMEHCVTKLQIVYDSLGSLDDTAEDKGIERNVREIIQDVKVLPERLIKCLGNMRAEAKINTDEREVLSSLLIEKEREMTNLKLSLAVAERKVEKARMKESMSFCDMKTVKGIRNHINSIVQQQICEIGELEKLLDGSQPTWRSTEMKTRLDDVMSQVESIERRNAMILKMQTSIEHKSKEIDILQTKFLQFWQTNDLNQELRRTLVEKKSLEEKVSRLESEMGSLANVINIKNDYIGKLKKCKPKEPDGALTATTGVEEIVEIKIYLAKLVKQQVEDVIQLEGELETITAEEDVSIRSLSQNSRLLLAKGEKINEFLDVILDTNKRIHSWQNCLEGKLQSRNMALVSDKIENVQTKIDQLEERLSQSETEKDALQNLVLDKDKKIKDLTNVKIDALKHYWRAGICNIDVMSEVKNKLNDIANEQFLRIRKLERKLLEDNEVSQDLKLEIENVKLKGEEIANAQLEIKSQNKDIKQLDTLLFSKLQSLDVDKLQVDLVETLRDEIKELESRLDEFKSECRQLKDRLRGKDVQVLNLEKEKLGLQLISSKLKSKDLAEVARAKSQLDDALTGFEAQMQDAAEYMMKVRPLDGDANNLVDKNGKVRKLYDQMQQKSAEILSLQNILVDNLVRCNIKCVKNSLLEETECELKAVREDLSRLETEKETLEHQLKDKDEMITQLKSTFFSNGKSLVSASDRVPVSKESLKLSNCLEDLAKKQRKEIEELNSKVEEYRKKETEREEKLSLLTRQIGLQSREQQKKNEEICNFQNSMKLILTEIQTKLEGEVPGNERIVEEGLCMSDDEDDSRRVNKHKGTVKGAATRHECLEHSKKQLVSLVKEQMVEIIELQSKLLLVAPSVGESEEKEMNMKVIEQLSHETHSLKSCISELQKTIVSKTEEISRLQATFVENEIGKNTSHVSTEELEALYGELLARNIAVAKLETLVKQRDEVIVVLHSQLNQVEQNFQRLIKKGCKHFLCSVGGMKDIKSKLEDIVNRQQREIWELRNNLGQSSDGEQSASFKKLVELHVQIESLQSRNKKISDVQEVILNTTEEMQELQSKLVMNLCSIDVCDPDFSLHKALSELSSMKEQIDSINEDKELTQKLKEKDKEIRKLENILFELHNIIMSKTNNKDISKLDMSEGNRMFLEGETLHSFGLKDCENKNAADVKKKALETIETEKEKNGLSIISKLQSEITQALYNVDFTVYSTHVVQTDEVEELRTKICLIEMENERLKKMIREKRDGRTSDDEDSAIEVSKGLLDLVKEQKLEINMLNTKIVRLEREQAQLESEKEKGRLLEDLVRQQLWEIQSLDVKIAQGAGGAELQKLRELVAEKDKIIEQMKKPEDQRYAELKDDYDKLKKVSAMLVDSIPESFVRATEEFDKLKEENEKLKAGVEPSAPPLGTEDMYGGSPSQMLKFYADENAMLKEEVARLREELQQHDQSDPVALSERFKAASAEIQRLSEENDRLMELVVADEEGIEAVVEEMESKLATEDVEQPISDVSDGGATEEEEVAPQAMVAAEEATVEEFAADIDEAMESLSTEMSDDEEAELDVSEEQGDDDDDAVDVESVGEIAKISADDAVEVISDITDGAAEEEEEDKDADFENVPDEDEFAGEALREDVDAVADEDGQIEQEPVAEEEEREELDNRVVAVTSQLQSVRGRFENGEYSEVTSLLREENENLRKIIENLSAQLQEAKKEIDVQVEISILRGGEVTSLVLRPLVSTDGVAREAIEGGPALVETAPAPGGKELVEEVLDEPGVTVEEILEDEPTREEKPETVVDEAAVSEAVVEEEALDTEPVREEAEEGREPLQEELADDFTEREQDLSEGGEAVKEESAVQVEDEAVTEVDVVERDTVKEAEVFEEVVTEDEVTEDELTEAVKDESEEGEGTEMATEGAEEVEGETADEVTEVVRDESEEEEGIEMATEEAEVAEGETEDEVTEGAEGESAEEEGGAEIGTEEVEESVTEEAVEEIVEVEAQERTEEAAKEAEAAEEGALTGTETAPRKPGGRKPCACPSKPQLTEEELTTSKSHICPCPAKKRSKLALDAKQKSKEAIEEAIPEELVEGETEVEGELGDDLEAPTEKQEEVVPGEGIEEEIIKEEVLDESIKEEALEEGVDEAEEACVEKGAEDGVEEPDETDVEPAGEATVEEGDEVGVEEAVESDIQESEEAGVEEPEDAAVEEPEDAAVKEVVEAEEADVLETEEVGVEEEDKAGVEEVEEVGVEEVEEAVVDDIEEASVEEAEEAGVEKVEEAGAEEVEEVGVDEAEEVGVEKVEEAGVEEADEACVEETDEAGVEEAEEAGVEETINVASEDEIGKEDLICLTEDKPADEVSEERTAEEEVMASSEETLKQEAGVTEEQQDISEEPETQASLKAESMDAKTLGRESTTSRPSKGRVCACASKPKKSEEQLMPRKSKICPCPPKKKSKVELKEAKRKSKDSQVSLVEIKEKSKESLKEAKQKSKESLKEAKQKSKGSLVTLEELEPKESQVAPVDSKQKPKGKGRECTCASKSKVSVTEEMEARKSRVCPCPPKQLKEKRISEGEERQIREERLDIEPEEMETVQEELIGEEPVEELPVVEELEAEEEPAVEEPVAAEEEPVAAEEEPVAAEEEPVAAEEEPVAAEEEPVAAEKEPVAAEEEPVAADEEPVAADEEPVAADEEPVAAEEEPVAEGPLAAEEEPMAAEEEPMAAEEEPMAAEEEPVAAEEGPIAAEEPAEEVIPGEEAREPEAAVVEESVLVEDTQPVDSPKPTDEPKPIEEPKPVEESRPVEEPKPLEEPKPVEAPKPAEISKPSTAPDSMEADKCLERIAELERIIAELKAENKSLRETSSTQDLRNECDEKLRKLKEEHENEMKKLNEVNREMMDSYKNELQMMKVQQNESASQLQEMHDELMQDRGQQYENEIAGLLKQLDMLRKNMQDELDKKDAEIEKLKFELITAKNAPGGGAPTAGAAPSSEDSEVIKNMLAEANEEMRKLKQELDNCKGRLLAQPGDAGKDALLDEIENLKNMLAEANNEIKRLQSEVVSFEKKTKSLIDENSHIKLEAEKIRRDSVILVESTQKLKEENQELRSSNSQLEMVKQKLSRMTTISSHATSRRDLIEMDKKYKLLQEENRALKNEVNKLKEDLSKCKAEELEKPFLDVCSCIEHPIKKVIYKILQSGIQSLTSEEVTYLHEEICTCCCTELFPQDTGKAVVQTRMKVLEEELRERQDRALRRVAELEQNMKEEKQRVARLYDSLQEESKRRESAHGQIKVLTNRHQECVQYLRKLLHEEQAKVRSLELEIQTQKNQRSRSEQPSKSRMTMSNFQNLSPRSGAAGSFMATSPNRSTFRRK